MTGTREPAHQLIDRLPETQLSALVGLLESIIDPVAAALRNAPLDNEPVTEEDRRRLREGQAWFAERGGKGISTEEFLAEFEP
jgi:hypothetical protein